MSDRDYKYEDEQDNGRMDDILYKVETGYDKYDERDRTSYLRKDVEWLISLVDQYKKTIKDLEGEVDDLEEDVSELEGEAEDLRDDKCCLESKIEALEEELEELREEINQ